MTELYINLKVIARARMNKIGKNYTDASGKSIVKIYVTSPRVQDKANIAVIELLVTHYKVAKSDIEIIKGKYSNNKTILIKNYNIKN